MIIQSGFFQHIYHIGCAFNLHSVINNGLIPGSQNSSKRQTVFFLPIDPRDKGHKDPAKIDFNEPRRAQYLHSAWKKHQDAVFWVDIDLAIRKGLTFFQTRSNAIILQGTLPAYCIPKVVRMESGDVIYEKVYMSPRLPPKISLKHDWKRELGSADAQRPEGHVVQQFKSSQSNQPIPNPQIMIERGRPLLEPIERGNTLLELTRKPLRMEEKRSVLRRSIHVLFTKKLSKTIERGNPLLKHEEPKHVHLMTARVSTLKWHMIERCNPLLKHTQIMCQMVPKHVLFMKAQASTLETKQFVIERGNPL